MNTSGSAKLETATAGILCGERGGMWEVRGSAEMGV